MIETDSEAVWQRSSSEIRRLRLLAISRISFCLILVIATGQFLAYGFSIAGFINYAVSGILIGTCFVAYNAAKTVEKFESRVVPLFTLFFLAIWIETILTGGFNSPTMPLLIGVPVAAAMLLRMRPALIVTLVNIAILSIVAASTPYLEMLQQATIPATDYASAIFINTVGAFLMVGFCAFIMAQQAESARKHMTDLIAHEANLAAHDQLSGLGNRNRLQQFFREIGPSKVKHDFLLIDLDGFKSINDTFGHNAGDYVIKAAAARLKEVTEADDMLIRLGGDEFLVVAPTGDTSLQKMNEYGTRLIEIISRPYPANGKVLRIGASIGHARYPIHGKSPSQALSLADKALYVAKGAGKGVCVTFGVAPKIKAQRKRILEKKTA
ncbi:MAG: GGDEF domain-containing protein [Pseudomonadota bacterium]